MLSNHDSLKKKFVSANYVPHMTKALCKAIMEQSLLESNYPRSSTVENRDQYKKQNNFC